MQISIRRNSRFNDIKVEHDGIKIALGLFDRKGSLELAKDLISHAEELLPAEHGQYDIAERVLSAVRESL